MPAAAAAARTRSGPADPGLTREGEIADNVVVVRTRLIALTLTVVAAAFAAPVASAATLEEIGSFTNPTYVTSEPADPDQLLVVERRGVVERWHDGVVTPYLDIRGLVSSNAGERGLASIALSPDYAASGQLYVFYSDLDGDLQIDEFTASGGSVSPATRRPVLTIEHSSSAFHNGGQLQFGPDGFLYISTGDGGVTGATAQDLGSLLGKLLRIWPHPAADPSIGYTTPSDNPYKGSIPGADEIWSYGLRNPWRFSFDRLNGDLVIADVGQGDWEEVDFEPAPGGGRADNFGWPTCEGPFFAGTLAPCTGFTAPAYAYSHDGDPAPCAITGGYVVRDASLGDLYGRYVFADLCTGGVSSVILAPGSGTGLRDEGLTATQPSSFGEDACGRIYLASLGSDRVYRLVGAAPADCAPAPPPNPGAPSATCGGEKVTHAAPATGGVLKGTPGKDVLVGSDEADRIVGRGGADVICGGDGGDTLKGGGGGDELRGGPGADELRGSRGKDRCRGGPGRDDIRSC